MSAVQGLRLSQVALLGLLAGLSGCLACESAHYVIRNPDRGVVAIPEDTPALRAKAEKLMHEQFPGGYVVDDVRVVAVGRPYHHHDEVMMYYHAGVPAQAGPPVAAVVPGRGPVEVPHVQPASFTGQPGDLPQQPVPFGGR